MGFVKILWKNNVQDAFLSKISISGQIVSKDISAVMLWGLNTNPSTLSLYKNHTIIFDVWISTIKHKIITTTVCCIQEYNLEKKKLLESVASNVTSSTTSSSSSSSSSCCLRRFPFFCDLALKVSIKSCVTAFVYPWQQKGIWHYVRQV